MRRPALALLLVLAPFLACASAQPGQDGERTEAVLDAFDPDWFEGLHWREVGPYRGGRAGRSPQARRSRRSR